MRRIAATLPLLLLAPTEALAYGTPTVQLLALPAIMLAALIIVSYAGGGYKIIGAIEDEKYKAKGKKRPRVSGNFVVGLFIALFAVVGAGAGFFLAFLCIFIYSMVRGGNMVVWGIKARAAAGNGDGDTPSHLVGANPKRLLVSGALLVIITLAVPATPVIFPDAFPIESRYRYRAWSGELSADAKNAFTAAQAYLTEHPGEKVDSLEKIKDGGYRRSANVEFGSANMTVGSGNMTLTSTALKTAGQANNTATVDHTGKVTVK